ncbi:MAG: hypothetical protein GTN80_06610 [Nitrososphaeria archaeon]|nr:hypothetical protein [Nitrososphaeria archaeon]NIQ33298.1 hypothetical protein [Nitrososphaeria archaeon]
MSRRVSRGRGRVGEGKGKRYLVEVSVKGKPMVRYHSHTIDLRFALSRYELDYPDAEIRYWEIDESNKRVGLVDTFIRVSAKTLKSAEKNKNKNYGKEHFMKISELSPAMKSVNIQAKVLEVSEPREVASRFGGVNRLAVAVIGDENGKINLTLWNQRIGSISVGDTVQIEKGHVTEYYGVKQLNIGRHGKIKVMR